MHGIDEAGDCHGGQSDQFQKEGPGGYIHWGLCDMYDGVTCMVQEDGL